MPTAAPQAAPTGLKWSMQQLMANERSKIGLNLQVLDTAGKPAAASNTRPFLSVISIYELNQRVTLIKQVICV